MSHVVLSATEILLLAASFYGWGSLVNNWSYGAGASGFAYPAALGMAAMVAVGGLLNLLYLARPPILLALLAVGLFLAAYFAYRSLPGFGSSSRPAGLQPAPARWNVLGNLVYFPFILAVFFFLVLALMPSRSFNFHDDFHVYFMWPTRMLQTGSLGGDPFDQLGFISLGGQSFLQGMFLAFGKFADINGFDAILCLVLSLWLLKEVGKRLRVHMVFIFVACLLALLINPQYVNVSSLYSGTLMLLGLVLGTMLLAESFTALKSGSIFRSALPCALFLAALFASKTTYVFLVPLVWAAGLAVSLWLFRERRRVLRAYAVIAGFTLVFLLPWLAVYLDNYIRKIRYLLADIHYPRFGGGPASGGSHGPSLTSKGVVLSQLFSNRHMFWGGNYRDFLLIDLVLLATLAVTVWVVWRRREKPESGAPLLPFLALAAGFFGTYLCYLELVPFRADQIIRYSSPILIAAAPMGVLVAGRLWDEGLRLRKGKAKHFLALLVLGGVLLLCQIPVACMCWDSFAERIGRAKNYGTLISFPLAHNPRYIEYNAYALSDEAANRVSWLQHLVPAGEPVFAWMSLPMYLDFWRNPIFPTAEFGISNPFLVMPLAEGTEAMRQFFLKRGIRYFIWEYRGYGMKSEAQLGGLQRKFIQALTDMIPASRILYKDGNTIVFEIGPMANTRK